MKASSEFEIDFLNQYGIDIGDVEFFEPDMDEAIVGLDEYEFRVIYSRILMEIVLVKRDGMTTDEAAEFIDFNYLRSIPYMGNGKPIIMCPYEN